MIWKGVFKYILFNKTVRWRGGEPTVVPRVRGDWGGGSTLDGEYKLDRTHELTQAPKFWGDLSFWPEFESRREHAFSPFFSPSYL